MERCDKSKAGKKRKVNRVDPESAVVKSPQGVRSGYSTQSVEDLRTKKARILHPFGFNRKVSGFSRFFLRGLEQT
jgi:hypothetical protein